jgi:hypothetical protein
MTAKEIIPVGIALIVALFVSFHAFQGRPPVESVQQVYEAQRLRRDSFLVHWTPAAFRGIVLSNEEIVRRVPRRSVEYHLSLKPLQPAAAVPAHPRLYQLENDPATLTLSALQGKKIRTGDTLVKQPGLPYWLLHRRGGKADTCWFDPGLF